jgi:AcrR family transcriptional regulator
MARLRWGEVVPDGPDSARTRLIDAAEACFRRFGVSKTTIDDVASAANVSRATVYRYFDGRDAVVLGVLEREGSRFMQRLQKRIGKSPDLSTALVDGILYTVSSVREDEHLAMLFAPEAVGLTVNIVGASEVLFRLTRDFFRPILEQADGTGQLRPGLELDRVAEWIVRVVLSLLTTEFEASRTARDQRNLLENFLVPAIVQPAPAATR